MIEAMGVWGQRWARRELAEGEIDMDLLLWGIETGGAGGRLRRAGGGPDRIHRSAGAQGVWWYLNEDGRCQLCVDDPGGETDLYLAATVADFIRVYRGDVPLSAALADGRLEAIGDRKARDRLTAWLNLSPLAAVRPARAGLASSAASQRSASSAAMQPMPAEVTAWR